MSFSIQSHTFRIFYCIMKRYYSHHSSRYFIGVQIITYINEVLCDLLSRKRILLQSIQWCQPSTKKTFGIFCNSRLQYSFCLRQIQSKNYEQYDSNFIIFFLFLSYNRFDYNQQQRMSEETVDFGGFSKQVKINPAVVLQILDVFCRNGSRIQATLLGKVYSSTIQILEAVPISIAEQNEIVKLDFAEHAKSLENIMNVYSRIQILGVAVTNLSPDNSLAALQTMYSNKQSGFKPQGILSFPLIVSINTNIGEANANDGKIKKNIQIRSFTFNKTYKYCKQLMNVVAFQQISTEISMGDADVQSMTPLFTALNDNEQVIPDKSSMEMIKELSKNLKTLKKYGNLSMEQEIKIRRVLDKLSTEQEFQMNQLAYLLDYASLQRRLSIKLNKFQKQ